MHTTLPLAVEDSDQIVPPTSRKVFVAVDEHGRRIGETHQNSKLSDAQVEKIRDLYENEKMKPTPIAAMFNVSVITIKKIVGYDRRATSIARWKVVLLHTPSLSK